ncbi:TPA: aldo/keto reductase [Candidatus Latescibacteria bacterium]|nr:aldo/keto reductase [Candidatus Latescibacterota bacterium]
MEYRQLGRSGLKVSEVCLGTMTFGHGTDEQEAQRMVDHAIGAGINFFDSANSYADAQSEVFLGKALKGKRKDVVVATKFYNPMGSGPNDSGMSRYHIMNTVEDSLKRLDMDHIDLFYIHHVDQETPLEEALRALDDLVRQGKVRYIACSNFEAWRLMEALWISDSNGLERFIAYQPQYSLLVRDIEIDLVPACQFKDVGIVTWSPLGGGFLSGKYKPGETSKEGTRSAEGWAYPGKHFHPNTNAILTAVLETAEQLGKSPAQVAIQWILEQSHITSVLVGARTVEHFDDNVRGSGWTMDSDTLARLNELSEPIDKYPERMERPRDGVRLSAIDMPSLE